MKVWLLTTEFPPYVGGGIGTYCHEYVKAAENSEITLTVFVSDWQSNSAIEVIDNVSHKVVKFNPDKIVNINGLFGNARLAYAFKDVVKQHIQSGETPDVIEAQDYQAITYFILKERATQQSIFENIPVCLTIHSPGYVSRQYNDENTFMLPDFWRDEMERFCIRACDARWSTSELLVNRLKDEFPNLDFNLIRNPMEISNTFEPNEGDTGIYYYGRVQVLKGVLPLIEAYANLERNGLKDKLYLIGGDTHYPAANRSFFEFINKRFKDLVERGMINIMGMMPREEAMKKVSRARLVVIPSLYENYAYAALEMISLKRVVVTSTTCGHSEILKDSYSGFIFDHKIKNHLEEKITEALNIDETSRKSIGNRAADALINASAPETFINNKLNAVKNIISAHVNRIKNIYPFIRPEPFVESKMDFSKYEIQDGLLSIVIPYFNLGDLLEITLKSALDVNYENKEIIILNASSTDPSSIAEFYRLQNVYSNNEQVKFKNIFDFGLADTRNRGAEIASGEYIAFLDPDDLVLPDYYPKAIEVLKRYKNVSSVGCWVQYFEGSDGQFIGWDPEPPFFLYHNMLNTAGSVFKRRDFLEFGRNDLNMKMGMEDYEAMISLIESGRGCVVLPELLFNYRVRANSMMRQMSRKNDIYAYEYMTRKHKKLFEKYAMEIVCLLNSNGPGFGHDNPQIPSMYHG